jgi:hypothetical protein
MILFIYCTHVVPNASICQYTVVDTHVVRIEPKKNLGRLDGWLEFEPRGSLDRKVAHSQDLVFGSSKNFAREGHSIQN